MPILNILRYPDERLHKVATQVSEVTDEIRTLVHNMTETMYAAPGIGLAATQVNVHQCVIVVDVSDSQNELQVLINPEIISSSGVSDNEEGCLSVPGVFAKVCRAHSISVKAVDINGQTYVLEASGLLAVCIQHEMDHLLGKVFVEYLSPLKQKRILTKLKKQQRNAM
ncbi:MAG: peptide deformylase [Nitrosomonadaceae bacterium]|nr:peptide deformylase [Nitrosomonadaceae bacterium]|tara:strand:+ start:98 stop:601 length:504 start_codon:yes stop_codon:yes gene_type:complete